MQKFLAIAFSLLIFVGSANADPLLNFEVGQKASYQIEGSMSFYADEIDLSLPTRETGTFDFVLEILDKGPEGNYPFLVDVKLQKWHKRTHLSKGLEETIVVFDTANPVPLSPKLQQMVAQLLDKSFRFQVNKDFNVTECSDLLAQLNLDAQSEEEQIFLSEFLLTLREHLGQIFHLADCSAPSMPTKRGTNYPVNLAPFLVNGKMLVSDDPFTITGESHFTVKDPKDGLLEGTWRGNTKLVTENHDFQIKYYVTGKVTWSAVNPLVQTRELNFKLNSGTIDEKEIIKVLYNQKWTSKPL